MNIKINIEKTIKHLREKCEVRAWEALSWDTGHTPSKFRDRNHEFREDIEIPELNDPDNLDAAIEEINNIKENYESYESGIKIEFNGELPIISVTLKC